MRFTLPTARRHCYSTSSATPLLSIPSADVYQFGSTKPVYSKPLDWTIKADPKEAWAIVGDGKQTLLDVLRGRLRVAPPPSDGIWPAVGPDPFPHIAYASFATRLAVSGGGFYDYTARYGGVREEDRVTLRESLPEKLGVEEWAHRLQIGHLLDLPLVALSNGQTRRAHVVRELLKKPEVLLLDEPLTGLDVNNRPLLLNILHDLHVASSPRVLMGLRRHDTLPEWITHVALAQGDVVETGPRSSFAATLHQSHLPEHHAKFAKKPAGQILVEANGVNVAYHERQVLRNINWTIREGERWHLRGPNGSGKTTLLSLLTGDHPQSYTQKHLNLFGKHRRQTATLQLQKQIGFVSPELFNAFPRRVGPQGLSVREAIATGLHTTFTYRPRTQEEDAIITDIVSKLGPKAWGGDTFEWDNKLFALLPAGEQSLVLLMRALVSKSPLLILDEAFAGMNDRMVEAAMIYLRNELSESQAAVFVTHWEQEVPWDDVKRITLVDGHAHQD